MRPSFLAAAAVLLFLSTSVAVALMEPDREDSLGGLQTDIRASAARPFPEGGRIKAC